MPIMDVIGGFGKCFGIAVVKIQKNIDNKGKIVYH